MQCIGRSAMVPLALVLVVAGAATAVRTIGGSSSKPELPGNAKRWRRPTVSRVPY